MSWLTPHAPSRFNRWIPRVFFSRLFVVFAAAGSAHAGQPDCETHLTDYSASKIHTVSAVLAPQNLTELVQIVTAAQLPISVRGGGFSMGGQVIAEHGLVVDMKNLNQIVDYDPSAKTIRVQCGATWRRIQRFIDRDNLSVKVMQSYHNFQVGGALGVNAHGRYVNYGPIISTVRSIRMLLADGKIVHADRGENSDLFFGAIGGYGALGIIVDVTLELTDNEKLERVVQEFSGGDLAKTVAEYLQYFEREVQFSDAVMTNADIYPPLFKTIRSVTFRKTDLPVTVKERLQPPYKMTIANALRSALVSGSHLFSTFKVMRDRYYSPKELSENRVVWRNYEAGYDLNELFGLNDYFPWTKKVFGFANQEAILQEYFIPKRELPAFVAKMRDVFVKHDVNVLNVSIRQVPKNTESVLSWSQEDSFALVIYYSQNYGFNPVPRLSKAQVWTQEMLDQVLAVGGTFYLPYQIYASEEQFRRGYPHADAFLGLKKKYDPDRKFSNLLINRYFPVP